MLPTVVVVEDRLRLGPLVGNPHGGGALIQNPTLFFCCVAFYGSESKPLLLLSFYLSGLLFVLLKSCPTPVMIEIVTALV